MNRNPLLFLHFRFNKQHCCFFYSEKYSTPLTGTHTTRRDATRRDVPCVRWTTVINLLRKPLIFSGNDFAGIWHPPTRGYHVRCVYFGDFYDGALRVPSVLGNLVMTFGSLRKKGRARVARENRRDLWAALSRSLLPQRNVIMRDGERAYRFITCAVYRLPLVKIYPLYHKLEFKI